MRRLILTTLALAFLAAPAAYANTRPLVRHEFTHDASRVVVKKTERDRVTKKVVRRTWVVGKPLPVWQHRVVIRDYHRYGLHRPGRGLQWVRIGNDYLLVRTGSNVVVRVVR